MGELKTMKCLRCSEDVQEVWLNQTFDIEEKTNNIKGFLKEKHRQQLSLSVRRAGT